MCRQLTKTLYGFDRVLYDNRPIVATTRRCRLRFVRSRPNEFDESASSRVRREKSNEVYPVNI